MEAFVRSVQQDVLRFDVRVDDAAALVQKVQPCQHLGEQAASHVSNARVPTASPAPAAAGAVRAVGHSGYASCGCSGVEERGHR